MQIAALTIPKTMAPEMADRLVKAGIKAIWNFAHTDLVVPDDVVVENVHLSESLMRLSYRVCSMQEQKERKERGPRRKNGRDPEAGREGMRMRYLVTGEQMRAIDRFTIEQIRNSVSGAYGTGGHGRGGGGGRRGGPYGPCAGTVPDSGVSAAPATTRGRDCGGADACF